ncbi:ferredoxin-thioredoxin reductase catalytic domain-containing protein [Methanoculleus sp. 7T]|uniref:ferredoxin-thioredoxin reductase catalytic domain-containing protein n=1 Tax=Methanoculleus sp. 7T TaxID=2937282 RepID=UPI0032C060E4
MADDEPTTLTEDELVKEIRVWAEEYAREHDLVLNPDERVRDAVIRGLARNQLRYGRRYCPCRIRRGVPEDDAKIACPCAYHQEEIASEGKCRCNLFFRKMRGHIPMMEYGCYSPRQNPGVLKRSEIGE